MAHLIKCRVCGGIASSAAISCPHCGDPYITDDNKAVFFANGYQEAVKIIKTQER